MRRNRDNAERRLAAVGWTQDRAQLCVDVLASGGLLVGAVRHHEPADQQGRAEDKKRDVVERLVGALTDVMDAEDL